MHRGASVRIRPIVLLVEDEPIVLEIAALELEEAGFEVIRARTGEDASRAIEIEHRIDILFTDLHLPGAIDGWEVARRARRAQPDIPVIYATGDVGDDPRRVSGSVVMSKPYRAECFVNVACSLGVGC